MDHLSDTPTPPPALPRYTPPVPSFVSAPDAPSPVDSTPVGSTPMAPAARLKPRVAAEPEIPLSPHGTLAPFNTRAIAAVIDGVVASGLGIATWMILPGFFGTSLPWLVGLAYLVSRDCLPFLGGQSVGKKAMHLQAVTLDGASLAGNWQPGLLRNAALAIPLFVFVEVFILLTREDKPEHGRRLGDEWAGTKVIVVQPATTEPPD
ncbi:MAG: RDD family protein [Verrucomicrobia bacterium]|nr:MAG: RDD family protein [Verrucomicrobiota bacterium]